MVYAVEYKENHDDIAIVAFEQFSLVQHRQSNANGTTATAAPQMVAV